MNPGQPGDCIVTARNGHLLTGLDLGEHSDRRVLASPTLTLMVIFSPLQSLAPVRAALGRQLCLAGGNLREDSDDFIAWSNAWSGVSAVGGLLRQVAAPVSCHSLIPLFHRAFFARWMLICRSMR